MGFDGVEDDGAAQSKFRGLSSGARASLRKKLMERTSGEVESAAFEPPSVATPYVDCLFFANELAARKDGILEAAKALSSSSFASTIDAFTALGGPLCDGAIPAYAALCEMDARAGDLRYRAWEEHQPRHAAFGLEAHGVAMIGAAAAAAVGTQGEEEEEGPLATLLEMWGSPVCVAAGPLSLMYSGDGVSDEAGRLHQLRGMARLLREALARRLPVIISCDAEAEADLARLVLAALKKAPPPPPPSTSDAPNSPTEQTPTTTTVDGRPTSWAPCTPIVVYGGESVGLWERQSVELRQLV